MKNTAFSTIVLTISAGAAQAGIPTPLPIAGATGPVGVAIAVVAYAGYRFWNRSR